MSTACWKKVNEIFLSAPGDGNGRFKPPLTARSMKDRTCIGTSIDCPSARVGSAACKLARKEIANTAREMLSHLQSRVRLIAFEFFLEVAVVFTFNNSINICVIRISHK